MAHVLAKTASRLPFLAERNTIAAALDDCLRAWDNVNSVPEVVAARAKSDELRRASDEASRAFSRVFDSYAPKDADARIAQKYPGVLVLGTGEEDCMQWIPRCAVTRLPIFVGDRVFIGGKDEGQRTYILAGAVSLAPGFETEPVIVNEDGEADLQKSYGEHRRLFPAALGRQEEARHMTRAELALSLLEKEGLSAHEAAEKMGVKVDTVRSFANRARMGREAWLLYCREAGERRRRRLGQRTRAERDAIVDAKLAKYAKVVRAVEKGETYIVVGARYNLTRNQVAGVMLRHRRRLAKKQEAAHSDAL